MLPKWHVLYSFVFSFILIYFFKSSILFGSLVFLAAIFIDLDHVFLYISQTKSINPFDFWKWSMEKKERWLRLSKIEKDNYKKPHFIFHGIEFLIIVALLSLLSNFFLAVTIGIIFHLVLDFFALSYEKEHISLKLSQIWLWQKNKNRKEFIFL